MAKAKTVAQLKALSENFYKDQPVEVRNIERRNVVNVRLTRDLEDGYARHWLPVHGPMEDPYPVNSTADGNCFVHAASRLFFGHEGYAQELRMRMVLEGLRDPQSYVDHNNLVIGFFSFEKTNLGHDLGAVYSSLSEAVGSDKLSAEDQKIPVKVFEHQMFLYRKKGAEAGGWAFHLLANVMQRPVLSCYPDIPATTEGFAMMRDTMTRIIYPFNPLYRDLPFGAIAWVATSPNTRQGQPNHFVAVVP